MMEEEILPHLLLNKGRKKCNNTLYYSISFIGVIWVFDKKFGCTHCVLIGTCFIPYREEYFDEAFYQHRGVIERLFAGCL
jgi:hypothetical protein